MNILIIRAWPDYLDVNKRTYNIQELGLAKALVRKGHKCDIMFWTDQENRTVELPIGKDGKIHVFYRKGFTVFKNTIFRECNDLYNAYDILQPSEYNQMQSWLLAKKYPQKTVIYHGPYYSSFNKRYNLMCKIFDMLFLKQYIRQGTRFLVKSEMSKEFLIKKGICTAKISVVGVGIDTQMLLTSDECNEPLYQLIKYRKAKVKLLYIGRFEKRRNIPFIINVFAKVLEQGIDAELYMVGSGNKNYMDKCFTYIEKVGLKNKIFWQEKIEQKYLHKIYSCADIFLLPTEYEIFGMVLLEAMYFKTVVLTTRNGGSSTLIQSGENGFIIESKNSRLWADIIRKLYNEKQEMKRIKDSAFETISRNYTWDALADKFLTCYKGMQID